MVDFTAKDSRLQPLHRMFMAVPRRYDLINHVITLGLDRRWRWQAARECLAAQPGRLLDLGCGTGDLAINLARLAEKNVELTGIDFSQSMLEIAAKKSAALFGGGRIQFIHGDVAHLPFRDGSFDCVGISFAFRNLTYRNPLAQRHLAEVLRVLSAGGRYVIVETSQPESKLIRKLYHLYLRQWVFRLGYLLSGNRGAYYYLADSAARFYTAGEVEEMLLAAGFRQVSYRRLCWGAVSIHVAVR
ncbi:MAG: ubiquinone/menaquinone biosynthesis methyltransferase [Chloroflexi bacterium]|nr:ubiquinone/menaquinone biosynthesis methyltransferase [Chloroflexota bacterium]MBI2979689.1 ubiquinone/menaquinone biosynthesis methyltransferase [Chloroflexota bacterium]